MKTNQTGTKKNPQKKPNQNKSTNKSPQKPNKHNIQSPHHMHKRATLFGLLIQGEFQDSFPQITSTL